MGKQIGFYMTESDEREFTEFLCADAEVRILRDRIATPEPEVLPELPDRKGPWGFKVWIWNSGISSSPKLHFVAAQKHYCLDPMPYEVIEFSRSRMDEGRLVRGRLWAEFTGWDRNDPSATIKKSDSFTKWFDRLAYWIRRHSARDHVGDYLLPGAAEYAQQGGTLVQAVFAKSVRYFHNEADETDSDREPQ